MLPDNIDSKVPEDLPEDLFVEVREDIKECMCLQFCQSFTSTWAGERVCWTCKTRSLWRSGRDWLPGGY